VIIQTSQLARGDVLADGQAVAYRVVKHRDGYVTAWWAMELFTRPIKRFYHARAEVALKARAGAVEPPS